MPEDNISITVTLRERDLLLRDTTAVDEDVLVKLRVAEVVNGKIRFWLSLDDLDLLLGDLAFDARFLRPLKDFGLLAIRSTKEPGDIIERDRSVRKTALFDRFILARRLPYHRKATNHESA